MLGPVHGPAFAKVGLSQEGVLKKDRKAVSLFKPIIQTWKKACSIALKEIPSNYRKEVSS